MLDIGHQHERIFNRVFDEECLFVVLRGNVTLGSKVLYLGLSITNLCFDI